MFGKWFGKKGNPSSDSKKKKDDELRAMGVDPSLFEDPVLEEETKGKGLGEENEDWDAMIKNANMDMQQHAKKKIEVNVPDVSSLLDDKDVEVEVTEEDMNDPKLLSSLRAIAGDEWDGSDVEIEEEDRDEIMSDLLEEGGLTEEDLKDPELMAEFKAMGGILPPTVSSAKLAAQLKTVTKLSADYKNAAVQSKKAGDLNSAKAHLLIYKSLESQKAILDSGKLIDESKLPKPPKPVAPKKEEKPASPPPQIAPTKQTAPPPIPSKPTLPLSKEPTQPNVPPKPEAPIPPKVSVQPNIPVDTPKTEEDYTKLLSDRAEEYKSATLEAKKTGDLQKAKNLFVLYKKIVALKEDNDAGKPVDLSQLPMSLKAGGSRPALPAKTPDPVQKQADPAVKATNNPPSKVAAPAVPKQEVTKDDEEEGEDPNPVDNMISNDVMEWAIKEIDAAIERCKAAKKPVPDTFKDKKGSIETALQVLQAEASSGQLDQEVYLQNLRNKIEEERRKAKYWLDKGRRDYAALALKRSKIMEAEIKATLEA